MVDDSGRADDAVDDGVPADKKPACVALVPVVSPAHWSRPGQEPSRPDSTFLTHLIATAEQVPKTRTLRRATLADAQTAYGANQRGVQSAGIWTRQII